MIPRANIATSPRRRILGALSVVLAAFTTLTTPSITEAADASEAHKPIATPGAAQATPQQYSEYQAWSGLQIMREAQRRHEQFPYVYEEQTMVLMDAQGNRSVRRCRRFSRTESDNSAKFLLIFDDPEEIRGVALLAERNARGGIEQGVYLPAFGAEFKQPAPDSRSGNFLGTDFSIEDLTTEALDEHRYVRGRDRYMADVEFFMVDAYPANAQVERSSGYGLRRHLIRKDTFMIVETDFFDRELRFVKRITHHDLIQVSGESWRANMIVVDDEREKHRTLLKIDRRVYSRDYVPAEIFERNFLLANGHLGVLGDRINGRLLRTEKLPDRDKTTNTTERDSKDLITGKRKAMFDSPAPPGAPAND